MWCRMGQCVGGGWCVLGLRKRTKGKDEEADECGVEVERRGLKGLSRDIGIPILKSAVFTVG